MIKLTKFYIKIFVKTPIFIFSLLFNIYIFIFQLKSLNLSILEYTGIISYAIISSNLFFLVITSSITAKRLEILDFLEKNEFKRYLVIMLSGVIISVITSIIPIIMILVFKNSSIEVYFVIKGVFDFFIIWNLSNMISISIGASIGILLKKRISIFISLIIYSFFPYHLSNPLFKSQVFNKFLNIFSDSTAIKTNILCDEIFDILYICKKMFLLGLILLIIILVKILLDKNKKTLDGIISISLVSIIGITLFIGNNSFTYIHKYDVSNLNNVDYHIKSYKMDINIGDKLENTALFQLDINNNIDSIIFLLDDLFKIREIKIDNESVNFIHKNNKIVLDYKTNKKKNINVEITYEGYIHIENKLGVYTFYCNSHVLNLTDSLQWYPCLYDNLPINYDIDINTSSTIYSNLDVENQGHTLLSKKYKVSGIAPEVDLFAGQYKKVIDNSIEYIIPRTYGFEDFKIKLDKKISSYLKNNEGKVSKDDLELLKEKKYKKVIIGMCVNTDSYIKISNNVLLINYM